jgi:hypothetical protein
MIQPAPEEDEQFELPESLREQLITYAKAGVSVPPNVDSDVLETAKQHLRTQRIRRNRWFLPGWAAAAAMITVLLVWSSAFHLHQRSPQQENRADIDGNGVVDIFDAFALARMIEQKQARVDFDVNHDGLIDERDVSAIAQRAVQLPRGTRL